MKKDFETFYNDINNQELNDTWEKAKKNNKRNKILSIVSIIITDIMIIYFLINNTSSNFLKVFNEAKNAMINIGAIFPYLFIGIFFLIIDIIIYIIIHVIFSKSNSMYNKQFKDIVVNALLKNFFSEVNYIPKKSMPENIYNEGKYEMYDRYYSDDYMDATIDNKYRIKMAEITTKEERQVEDKEKRLVEDSDGNTITETVTLFKGLFAKIDIEKSINNELRISNNIIFSKKNKLNMDSQEFEKYFDVTSTDKIIGMQLLTHDIMDILINYRKELGKEFDIYIKDDVMYIRLHVGEMFEAKFNKKTSIDKDKLQTYYTGVEFIDKLSRNMIEVVEETQI